jgi:hypothetical protein
MKYSLAGKGPPRVVRSGALAGAATAFVFALVHHLLISDIWFSLIPMMIAGAACGACLGWSYALVFGAASPRTWAAWNAVYLTMFVLLGVLSLVVYEPVTTAAALLAGDGPPGELFGAAMPLTVLFTLGAAAAISLLWGRTLAKAAAILVTCTVLMLLFGLNISVLGLVQMVGDEVYLVGLFFALIILILAVNAVIFYGLERNRLFAAAPAPEPRGAAEPVAAGHS